MTIRIVLADDHKILRQSLKLALEAEGDMEVVGEAGTGREILSLVQAVSLDVLVLDIGLPDMSGVEVAQEIGKRHPGVRMVVLSGYTDRIFVEETMRAGASAFIVKAAGSEELVLAIRAAHAGKLFLSPDVAAGMVKPEMGGKKGGEKGETPPASVLGKREQEVLRLLAEGLSSPEIAVALGISSATVDVHRRNIKQKLGLSSIAELTRYAIREGLASVR